MYYFAVKRFYIILEDEIEVVVVEMKVRGLFGYIVWIVFFYIVSDMVKVQDVGVIQMYRVIKVMFVLGYGGKWISLIVVIIKIQFVQLDDIIDLVYVGIYGLVGLFVKEYLSW